MIEPHALVLVIVVEAILLYEEVAKGRVGSTEVVVTFGLSMAQVTSALIDPGELVATHAAKEA